MNNIYNFETIVLKLRKLLMWIMNINELLSNAKKWYNFGKLDMDYW